jgi:hypothetical protein
MTEYEFDVFLSVKDDAIFNEWVRDVFLPLFTSYLKNDIIETCNRPTLGVFYYGKNLELGDPWPTELRDAIRGSRLALALCSPEYFFSRWCLTELHSFLARAKSKTAKVLVPVSIHDGAAFPEEVRQIQVGNLASFVVVGEGFKSTKSYSSFQTELKALSKRVATLVAKAPPFEDWQVIDRYPPGAEPEIAQQTIST